MPDDKHERPMKAGDLVHLTTAASVQFLRPIVVRVIRELPERHTYDGWVWIEGYQLNAAGDAVARRELYVRRAGVCWLVLPAAPAKLAQRRPGCRGPVRVG
ncbi:hypothetical protein ACQPZK_23465 [Micromonospora sp. CA-249363]|uniref:hypothetical protein n=1 Tax=Micromonospora sp. CA-249363 TaxID=3239963 RepID=UPI003D8F7501